MVRQTDRKTLTTSSITTCYHKLPFDFIWSKKKNIAITHFHKPYFNESSVQATSRKILGNVV